MKSLLVALAAAAGPSLGACGTTDSSSLLTRGMSAEIVASTNGSGTTQVSAELFAGVPAQLIFVDLQNGDQLVATNGSTMLPMVKTQVLTIIEYTATFPTGSEGDQFEVDLRRMIDAGAPSSVATLPAAFAISPPPATAQRSQPLTIAYGPSGTTDTVTWQAQGDCINETTGTLQADTGTIALAANAIVQPMNAATQCMVTFSVIRSRAGVLDAHYGKGGSVAGQQTRQTTFTSTP